MENIKDIIESLLFISKDPLSIKRIQSVLPFADAGKIYVAIQALSDEYEARKGGFHLCEVAGGYQIRTRPEYKEWIKQLVRTSPPRLSKSAMETLAIIAWNQPIIRSEVERIRGVDSGGVIRALLERNLVRVLGRKEIPGRPLIYATTRQFLEVFELKSLKDLPSPKEIEELGSATLEEETSVENTSVDETLEQETSEEETAYAWEHSDGEMGNDKTAMPNETDHSEGPEPDGEGPFVNEWDTAETPEYFEGELEPESNPMEIPEYYDEEFKPESDQTETSEYYEDAFGTESDPTETPEYYEEEFRPESDPTETPEYFEEEFEPESDQTEIPESDDEEEPTVTEPDPTETRESDPEKISGNEPDPTDERTGEKPAEPPFKPDET